MRPYISQFTIEVFCGPKRNWNLRPSDCGGNMPTTMQPMRIKHIERLKNKVLMEHCILLKFLQPKIPVCFDLFSSFQQFRYINFIFFKEMPMIWIRTVDRSLLDTTALPNVPQLLPYTVQFCSKKFPIKCNKITREDFRGNFRQFFVFAGFQFPAGGTGDK